MAFHCALNLVEAVAYWFSGAVLLKKVAVRLLPVVIRNDEDIGISSKITCRKTNKRCFMSM
jgi:hypothetical protein